MPTIFHDFVIHATIDKVFEAVSTPKGLDNWWTKKSSGKQEIGSVYNLYFSEEYDWFAEIKILSLNDTIEFKILKAKEEWLPTSFGFIVTKIDTSLTSVEFYHKDWETTSKEYKIANFCWAELFLQMKQYLEKGIITPFNKRN